MLADKCSYHVLNVIQGKLRDAHGPEYVSKIS
jgi:hypothetical protein